MNRPKRILVIGLTERMGGVETFIYNTMRFSHPEQYQFDYLVHGANHCVFQNEITEFYGSEQHIYFVEKYKANPFRCLRNLISFYCENGKKYDWIHLQTGATSEVLYVFPFCLFLPAKVITHSHNGNGYSPIVNRLFQPFVNLISDKRIACSNAAADWLFGEKSRKKVLFLQNGVDTQRFTFSAKERERIRREYGIKSEFLVGHIGRFSEQKNHVFLIRIFHSLLKKKPDSCLMLVGCGEKENEIRALCRELQIVEKVIFAGLKSNTEDYYGAFDAFVMPSLYEGLPIVGIEAQCEGLPCLFSEEIDRAVLLTDQAFTMSLTESADQWSDAVLKLSSGKHRERYAQEVANSGFSIQTTVEKLEEIYKI